MARSVLEIYDEMMSEKQTMVGLNSLQPNIDSGQQLMADLTNAAKVAVWRLFYFVVAFQIRAVEVLFDDHKAWIEQRATEIVTGTLWWYRQQVLEWQYGDVLVFLNGKYQYNSIDESARIVKFATASDVAGSVLLKVAKDDGTGYPEELTTPELTALQQYMKKVKFAGTKISVVSRPADLMKIHYKVYYDPLVLSASGERLDSPGVFPVEDAIKDYCKNLPFDGVYSITECTDRIQSVEGVLNPVHQTTEVKYGANPYTTFVDYHKPNAGYAIIDPAHPLSVTITYLIQP